MLSNTKHADIRMQQRCIPPFALELLDRFGVESHQHDGTVLIRHTKKSCKLMKRELGSHFVEANKRLLYVFKVESLKNGSTITVGWLH
jgi:hypothetical protein